MTTIKVVTEEMINRAEANTIDANDILNSQRRITDLFQQLGKEFSGKTPKMMTDYMTSIDKDYADIGEILDVYKTFIIHSARNYEWTDEDLVHTAKILGLTR